MTNVPLSLHNNAICKNTELLQMMEHMEADCVQQRKGNKMKQRQKIQYFPVKMLYMWLGKCAVCMYFIEVPKRTVKGFKATNREAKIPECMSQKFVHSLRCLHKLDEQN